MSGLLDEWRSGAAAAKPTAPRMAPKLGQRNQARRTQTAADVVIYAPSLDVALVRPLMIENPTRRSPDVRPYHCHRRRAGHRRGDLSRAGGGGPCHRGQLA